ncbi:hypothetical protein K2173_019201 [Erythroxylum novogranatense]|uniref:Translation initiation factor 5A C-terminal domain-containing protein n=1 Tax=Erythroxylum novogranatense TaxID=1862640 RepID=A0AAV8STY4_9ROSI|nr:hypothetical protein K2173_019201 [Erythroxylum novogranatense]
MAESVQIVKERLLSFASVGVLLWARSLQAVEVSTSKTSKHEHAKCHFEGIDIFNVKKLEDIVPSSHNCDVPHVNRTSYSLLISMKMDFLLTENGNTKDDLRLPIGENLLTQIKDGFTDGKDLVVTVMSAIGFKVTSMHPLI